ncbi:MAG: hypothetical protein Kow0029_24900 [Candidatus Rifleibacteriota bacterium]
MRNKHNYTVKILFCLFLVAIFKFPAKASTGNDIAFFANRADKLARLCEGALHENSYLHRLSKKDQLTSVADLRPVYRFFRLYLDFSTDIEKVARKYQVPLFKHDSAEIKENFEAYLLGISARLVQIVFISELMNFVEKRPKLELLLNEANKEFKIEKDSLRHEINRVIQVKELARLYRFRLSNYENMMLFYQGKLPFKPVHDNDRILLRLIQSQKPVLDNLLKTVASKPAWKILANTVFDKSLDFILPAQKAIFTWVGDSRIKKRKTRLISPAQIRQFKRLLKPGDIILERQDWYLSNIFLPGFWPHGIIYLGDSNELIQFFKDDNEVSDWCRKNGCRNFVELLEKDFPAACKAFLRPNQDGHTNVVIEAISEGVVFNSIEHSCKADYLAALRPNLRKIDIARSIHQAFYYFGREYDFRFNFDSEQTLVCTELVSKAYCRNDGTGLKLPYTSTMGKYGVTADSIAETFAREHGHSNAQLKFVAFLLGFPQKNKAEFVGVEKFKLSPTWRGGLVSSDLN